MDSSIKRTGTTGQHALSPGRSFVFGVLLVGEVPRVESSLLKPACAKTSASTYVRVATHDTLIYGRKLLVAGW